MKKDEIIQIARDVLKIESHAVQALVEQIDENFSHAVELLSQAESRVIVTGIGKSGLVARKIAATLSSCGSPAIFVHPVEAGHGDLGMIMEKDIVLALSYSGDTREIVDILDFVKRIGIKLIGITGNKKSKLAKYSDITLEVKVEREADPSGMIPTSSSTAFLALGDALAIALMKKKGFGKTDFAFFHPKGQLGKKLTRIEGLMHKGRQIPLVSRDAPMLEVLKEMSSKHLGMTCIVDDKKKIIGIITDGDVRRLLQKYGETLTKKTAEKCMTPNPQSIDKDELATKGLNIMEKSKITSLIVTNKDDEVLGIIHLHDLWRTEMI